MSLRRARAPEKLVEWVRAKFAPSHKKQWKSNFKRHFANRNARPLKTTEDDDPSLEEFRVRFKGVGRRSCGKNELIDRAVARLARIFSEDETSRQEAGAAADAEASAPDHDVAVLGAAARSNATPPPDGVSEETLCKRQRTSRDPTGGSVISMADLGRSDNASATGTAARDGHNSPHSLGDSYHGTRSWTVWFKFGDRISAVKYLLEFENIGCEPFFLSITANLFIPIDILCFLSIKNF